MTTSPNPAQDDVVSGWWEYQRLSAGNRQARKNLELGEPRSAVVAADAVHDLIRRGGVTGLALVKGLVDAATSADDLVLVAAGPLEDLLVEHGRDMIDEIDLLARQNPRFAAAMSGVWWSSAEAGPEVTRGWRSGSRLSGAEAQTFHRTSGVFRMLSGSYPTPGPCRTLQECAGAEFSAVRRGGRRSRRPDGVPAASRARAARLRRPARPRVARAADGRRAPRSAPVPCPHRPAPARAR